MTKKGGFERQLFILEYKIKLGDISLWFADYEGCFSLVDDEEMATKFVSEDVARVYLENLVEQNKHHKIIPKLYIVPYVDMHGTH